MKFVMIQFCVRDEEPDLTDDRSDLLEFFAGLEDGQVEVLDLRVDVKQLPAHVKWPEGDE